MLRRPVALVAAIAAALVLAGCSGGSPEAPRSVTRVATPTVPPLVIPTRSPDEVARSTFAAGSNRDAAGRTPASGALAVEVACAGVDGSMMRWSLVSGDGTSLGLSGEADCSGPPTTSSLGITAQQRPAKVAVRLLPTSGVVSGYAIVEPAAF